MSGDSPRRTSGGGGSRGLAVPAVVPPQVVSDRSILDSAIGFINEVTLANQPHIDPKDTITWARFETSADISDPRFGEDWELEGNAAPPLILILGYGLGVQVWAIPANGEAVEVLSWRHGIVSALRVLPTPAYSATIEVHGREDESVDAYAEKRPLIALVDGSASAGVQPQFCAVNFISLKTGTQMKTIKFKNPVLDILANRSSIVITFHERIAVFDASTLDDRLSITTCYPSPGINPNPVALGPRWLAYAEHKLLHSKRSGGGCDGDGVPSYTATMLNAAKSFGKGLRELGEQVAAGLTGSAGGGSMSKNNSFDNCSSGDVRHPGIITILDIKHPIKDYSPTSGTPMSAQSGTDPIVAHFIAHLEAVVSCEFDNSGMLLVTADRRGHDFHVFRIQPHPVGSSLAAVHHLYVLHRGDTSAKVQNISFSLDSRWVAVSTLRGTTHVFPITPYGGAMGVRTHTSLHVVNKLSRFHRSAGLSADGRSSSPISHSESTTFIQSLQPYHNPTLPPFSRPTVVLPLTQLRQPFTLGSPPGSASLSGKTTGSGSGASGSTHQRQRLSSLSDDSGKPLSVCATFAKSRSWLLEPPNATREAPHRIQRKAVDSLFVMAGHGALIQYDLDVKLASNVAKEKICDDTPIELEVEAKAQWNLGRRKDGSQELTPPLSSDNWLIKSRNSCMLSDSTHQFDDCDDRAESWLSQVEIITHAGPHRRLWMGPQFVFKTYNTPSGSNLSHVDAEAVEIGVSKAASASAAAGAAATTAHRIERSSPLNMPLSAAGRSTVPVLIESGSYSSIEQSPKLMDRFRHDHMDSDYGHGDTRLKEDLADAMRESPSVSAAQHHTGRLSAEAITDNTAFYDALAEHDDDDPTTVTTSAVALENVLPNIYSFDPNSKYESLDSLRKAKSSIEKIVNPLGTVTTIMGGLTTVVKTDMLDEVVLQLAAEECVIHENCDESLFRPVVAIFCDEKERQRGEEEARRQKELAKPPEAVGSKLIVPVIEKEVDDVLNMKEKQKYKQNPLVRNQSPQGIWMAEQKKFNEFSGIRSCEAEKTLDSTKVILKSCEKEPPARQQLAESAETIVLQLAKNTNPKPANPKLLPPIQTPRTTCAKATQAEIVVSAEEETALEFKRMTPLPAAKPIKPTANPFKISAKVPTKTKTAAAEKSTNDKENEAESEAESASTILNEEMHISASVHTESLNVAHLTDSLMDLDDSSSSNREREEKLEANSDTLIAVEISEAPAKQTTKKSNKKSKRQNKSSSNSESEELIEIKTSKTTTKTTKAQKKGHVESVADLPASFNYIQEKPSASASASTSSSLTKTDEESIELEESTVSKKCQGLAKVVSKIEPKLAEVEPEKLLVENQKTVAKSPEFDCSSSSEEYQKSTNYTKCSIKSKKKPFKPETSDEDESMKKSQNCDQVELMLKSEENYPNKQREDVKTKQFNKNESISENDEEFEEQADKSKKKATQKSEELREKTTKQIMQKTKIGQSKETDYCVRENEKKNTSGNENENDTSTCKEKNQTKTKDQPSEQSKSLEESKNKKSNMDDDLEEKEETDETVKLSDLKSKEPNTNQTQQKQIREVPRKRAKENITNTTNYKEKTTVSKQERADKSKSAAENDELQEQNIASKDGASDNDNGNAKQNKELSSEKNKGKAKIASIIEESVNEREKKLIGQDATGKETTQPLRKDAQTLKANNVDINPLSAATEKQNEKTKEYKIKIIEDERKEAEVKLINKQKTTTITSNADIKAQPKATTTLKESSTKPDNDKSAIQDKRVEDIGAVQPLSAWSTLSGAAMISKNLEASQTANSQTAPSKSTSTTTTNLLQNLPMPLKPQQEFKTPPAACLPNKLNNKKPKKSPPASLDDFPSLQPFESLPPLPALQPLEDDITPNAINNQHTKKTTATNAEQQAVSLINFESPLQEQLCAMPAVAATAGELLSMEPTPRGFQRENLIFALCGSLHYEHEMTASTSSTTSLAKHISASDENLKSSATTTTKTYKHDKVYSSSNSSASEDIIVLDDKKLTKKQRRKRQQQQHHFELQKEKEHIFSPHHHTKLAPDMCEEMRPLIGGMTDSQMDIYIIDTMLASDHFDSDENPPAASTATEPTETTASALSTPSTAVLVDDGFELPTTAATTSIVNLNTGGGGNSTTTDSEGPMPATTSDDNICSTSTFATTTTSPPNKIKTKKLEHKINLIAAIEAATSSSTSSAEESGIDGGLGGRASDSDLLTLTNSKAAAAMLPIAIPLTQSVNALPGQGTSTKTTAVTNPNLYHTTTTTSPHHQHSAMKKKTKRRKR